MFQLFVTTSYFFDFDLRTRYKVMMQEIKASSADTDKAIQKYVNDTRAVKLQRSREDKAKREVELLERLRGVQAQDQACLEMLNRARGVRKKPF